MESIMFTMYGLGHCSTVHKAQKFLTDNNAAFTFINYADVPLDPEWVLRWKQAFGDWPVNKASYTYRPIKEEFEGFTDDQKLATIIENPALIRRPVLEKDGVVVGFGFGTKKYATILED